MNMKPRAAFGYVLIENTYADGETWRAIINDDIKCTTFWVKGLFKNKHLTLGSEDFEDFQPGRFLRPVDYMQGVFEHTSVGESKVFCFDQRLNNNQYVELSPFLLSSGNQATLPIGTKLFLCAGSLSMQDRTIEQPTQIHIQSGDTLVSASTDCYGLLFP